MRTGSNAVIDLVRQTSTRRLETDPGDDALFQSRDESSRSRWPRGTVNWGPPPPEPVTHPPAPVKRGSWKLKIAVLAIAGVAGVAVAMIGFSSTKPIAGKAWTPPPLPVIAVPTPPPPAPAPVVAPTPPPSEPTVVSSVEPTIGPAPTVDDTPPVVDAKPAPVKAKRRVVHAAKKHVAKTKHVATAPTAPTETAKTTTAPPPAAPAKRRAQAQDNENPL